MKEVDIQNLSANRSKQDKQLRLQLAASAMTALLNNPAHGTMTWAWVAEAAVLNADLLLAELEK